jgi:DNA-binding response OmpR family regulator
MTDAISDAPRILLVEDELGAAALLGHIFEVDGYRVLYANDCERAIALAGRTPSVEAAVVDVALLEGVRDCEEAKNLRIVVVERPLSLDRLREVLRRVHECAPFPDESRSATAKRA